MGGHRDAAKIMNRIDGFFYTEALWNVRPNSDREDVTQAACDFCSRDDSKVLVLPRGSLSNQASHHIIMVCDYDTSEAFLDRSFYQFSRRVQGVESSRSSIAVNRVTVSLPLQA